MVMGADQREEEALVVSTERLGQATALSKLAHTAPPLQAGPSKARPEALPLLSPGASFAGSFSNGRLGAQSWLVF